MTAYGKLNVLRGEHAAEPNTKTAKNYYPKQSLDRGYNMTWGLRDETQAKRTTDILIMEGIAATQYLFHQALGGKMTQESLQMRL